MGSLNSKMILKYFTARRPIQKRGALQPIQEVLTPGRPSRSPAPPTPERLGDLFYALYIPTAQEEVETQAMLAAREAEVAELDRLICPTGISEGRAPPRPRPPPIRVPDVTPAEEGFKWLPNYIPFERQVRGQRYIPPPEEKKVAPGPKVCKPAPIKGRQPVKRPSESQVMDGKKKVCKKLAQSATRLSQMKKPPVKESVRPPPSPKKTISKAQLKQSLARLTKSKGPAPPAKAAGPPSTCPPGRGRPTTGPTSARRPCPPARQAGPPTRQAGPAARMPCPRQAGPPARKAGPAARQTGPAVRQAGPAARQAAPAARRPCPPTSQAGGPMQRPGPPMRQPCPPVRQQPCPAAGSPLSPYDVNRVPGYQGQIQSVIRSGPVPIVSTRKSTEVQGPRIYMPPEALLEREKRLAKMGKKVVRKPQPVCSPAKGAQQPAPYMQSPMQPPMPPPPRSPERRVPPPAHSLQQPTCPAGIRPEPIPTPVRTRPQSMQPPGAPMKKPGPARQIAPPMRQVPVAPRRPVQHSAAPPPPQQPCPISQIAPPPTHVARPRPIPLPLEGEIQNVYEGGPVPVVTARNVLDVQCGPRIYMPAEAILERQQRLRGAQMSQHPAMQKQPIRATKSGNVQAARACPKAVTGKKSASATAINAGGRTVVGGPKGGPSKLSRQDRCRRR